MFTKTTKIIIILTLLLTALCLAEEEKNKAEDSITMAELKDHMYYLSSDALGGRVVGSEGYRLATIYAQAQFRAAGLVPILKDSDGNPTFLQKVPLTSNSYTKSSRWVINSKAGEKKFIPGKNILCIQISGPDIIKEPTELAFLGYGISEPESGWNDLEGIDLKNKIPVLMLGAPTENGKPVLPEKLHKSYLSVPGAEKKVTKLARMGFTRVVFIADDEISQMWPMLPRAMANSVVTMEGSARRGPANMVVSVINEKVASHLFSGQEYNPFDKAEESGYKSFVLKDATIRLKAEAKEENIETWNVVGMITGTDPKLKDEFVVIGGHLDHVPPVNGEVCNGADDNASGSIGVIETAEALAMKDNKRSILVCLWAAEEVGLYGSSWFVNHPPVNVEQMKVNINLDMIARTDNKNSKDRAIWALGSSRANPKFKEFIQNVNQNSVNWPLNMKDSDRGMGGSDHASFMRKGIPALFFYSGPHNDYHRPTDDAENLEWEKFLKVSRLACRLVDELANTDIPLESFKATPTDQ